MRLVERFATATPPGFFDRIQLRGQRQRIFLADVRAVLVDDRQPVGVRVLCEADRRLLPPHLVGQAR